MKIKAPPICITCQVCGTDTELGNKEIELSFVKIVKCMSCKEEIKIEVETTVKVLLSRPISVQKSDETNYPRQSERSRNLWENFKIDQFNLNKEPRNNENLSLDEVIGKDWVCLHSTCSECEKDFVAGYMSKSEYIDRGMSEKMNCISCPECKTFCLLRDREF